MDNQKETTGSKKYRKVGPYLLLNIIGRGAYSVVYEAKKQGDKKKYAVKQISLVTVTSKQLERVHLQIKVLTLIKHHNIVCLLDYKQTSRNLYLVFEYCKHTDLETYVSRYCTIKMPQEKVRKIAIQIKNAFQVLRANKVVHRDLKLANILVTQDFQIKIADFGFAKHLDDNEFLKSYVGTPLTMAPQILENRNYNEKCDLWSLGIMLYQLLFGKNPFFTKQRMTKTELQNAIKGNLNIPKQISEQAEDLIRKLIIRQPAQRISFEEFFRHPWLSESNSVNNLNQDLLEQALRSELKKTLIVSLRKKQQKQFLQKQAQDLLAYEIIQNVKNTIETKIMFWINLGKKIMCMQQTNKKLSFLAIAVLMENLNRYQNCNFILNVNQHRKISLNKYSEIRNLQKWQMSQYTKRLPGFIERSWTKMAQYIKQIKYSLSNLDKKQLQTKISHLFLIELTSQIVKQIQYKNFHQQLSTFIKIRPFTSSQLNLRITSNMFNDNTIDMLLMKLDLHIENNKMYRKCVGIYKLETLFKDQPEDKIFQNIKNLLE